MTIEVLDPTYNHDVPPLIRADRPGSLAGLTVGIVSNGKHGTKPFFKALERELRDRYRVAEVVHVTKPNYSAPAGNAIMDQAREWHALVAGVGD